jgi:hypothetical protein
MNLSAISLELATLLLVRFFDSYRSYVINYNFGKDMVKDYIERDTNGSTERWKKFEQMLSSPMLPADLQ